MPFSQRTSFSIGLLTGLALGVSGFLFGAQQLAPDHFDCKPATCQAESEPQSTPTAVETFRRSKDRVSAYLTKAYHVDPDLAQRIVEATLHYSEAKQIDPFLAIAIMAKESSFRPEVVSAYGATGLMQVYAPGQKNLMVHVNGSRISARKWPKHLVKDVHFNVAAGIHILCDNLDRSRSVGEGLQRYNGNRKDPALRYANKVLHLHQAFVRVAGIDAPTRAATDPPDSFRL